MNFIQSSFVCSLKFLSFLFDIVSLSIVSHTQYQTNPRNCSSIQFYSLFYFLYCSMFLYAAKWCTTTDSIVFISVRWRDDRNIAHIRFAKVHFDRNKTIKATMARIFRSKESTTRPIVRIIKQLCKEWCASIESIFFIWTCGFFIIASLSQ